jgi:hypothetical protein
MRPDCGATHSPNAHRINATSDRSKALWPGHVIVDREYNFSDKPVLAVHRVMRHGRLLLLAARTRALHEPLQFGSMLLAKTFHCFWGGCHIELLSK